MNGIDSKHAPALDLPARFMLLSVAALAISALSAPWSLPLLQGGRSDFHLLAFVHLNTLGVVGAMIFGASYQLVPVALQTPLASARAGRISFWFFAAGLAVFLIGLLATWLPGLAAGATLLGVAFALYIGVILATFRDTTHRDVVAWHIAAGSVNAGLGMIAGVLLAFNKSNGMLGGRLLWFLAAHLTIMLAGWVILTFFGVAYRLIGMFTLAERHFIAPLAWTEFAGVLGGTWLLAARFLFQWPRIVGQAGAALLLLGAACFAGQIVQLHRTRMRRAFDIHAPFAFAAALSAFVATGLLVIGLIARVSPVSPLWTAIVFLALFGVAETAIQGFFYKIATFLVWLKRYAPVAGAKPVPKLEEMYSRRLAAAGWGLWTLAIAATALALAFDWAALVEIAPLMTAGAACFVINVALIARHWRSRQPAPTATTKLVIRRAPS